jgi:hypothetical protein
MLASPDPDDGPSRLCEPTLMITPGEIRRRCSRAVAGTAANLTDGFLAS